MSRRDTVLERTTVGYQGQGVPLEIPVSTYPTETGVIIVNSPGVGEGKDGYRSRYATIAEHLHADHVGCMITYAPPLPDAQLKYPDEPYSFRDASWNRVAVESGAHVLDYALANARQLCGSDVPTVYLAGFSAGASV